MSFSRLKTSFIILVWSIVCVHLVKPEGLVDGLSLSKLLERLVDKDGLNHADLQVNVKQS